MLRSRANEITELIRQLESRSRSGVDAARARLSIIGPRAVEDLIEALEGNEDRIRARVMPLLAMIQDPRGREPLVAMLLDRNARLRAIAARCLARFPAPDAVAGLHRALQRDASRIVRVAAVHALVEQYAAGQERAIRMVLDLLLDARQQDPIRFAALSLLRHLRAAQRRGILARLREDPSEAMRVRAQSLAAEPARSAEAEIPSGLADLGSGDYPVWNEAVQRLGASGVSVIEPLITEMRRRSRDPEFCTRAGMVLKALGPRRGRSLASALERVTEPLPLQVLVEVVGALGEKSLIYRLKELIDRLAASAQREAEPDGFDPMLRVRAMAHLELARIGSRVAIGDLRACLADEQRRVEVEMLAAVGLIGKKEELVLLLRAYQREDEFIRERIGDVVRTIMKRERIRRNSRTFSVLSADQRRTLVRILPPVIGRARRPHRRSIAS